MPGKPRRRLVALVLAVIACLAIAAALLSQRPAPRAVGLFTTLPILWHESEDLTGLLATDRPPHWAVGVIEGQGPLRPLDTLEHLPAGLGLVVMAQPRALSPGENVALDNWVRGGGRVLLFADPMLTQETAFALGDRRRPLDTVVLSPILARWGLRLEFDDESAQFDEYVADAMGARFPVNIPGRFAAVAGAGQCKLVDEGLLAECRVGEGHVLALADAAMLEPEAGGDAAAALAILLQRAAD